MPEPHQDPISERGSTPSDEVIDVRYPCWISNILVVVCLSFLAIIFVYLEVILPKNQQVGREPLPWFYGSCILFAAMFCLLRKMTIIRIDAQGVAAHRRPYSLTAAMVPWDEISSCDFVKVCVPGPMAPSVVPVLRDPAGRALFANLGNLRSASPADQRRVLQALESRFRNPLEPSG
jgi:hypothetical protein